MSSAPPPPRGDAPAASEPRRDTVRFRFDRCLGVGGFGEVYLARMTTGGGLSREVAVKLLITAVDPGSVLRLRDEARLLAALNHRAILQVFDLVEVEGRVALCTEFIDGTNLSGFIAAGGPLPVKVALEVVGDVASALAAALATPSPDTGAPLRLVHRDIKPGNIRVARSGAVKLLDFGIALSTAIDREARTGTGLIVGTLGYLAPERLREPEVNPESDVYALGCVLFEALTGERLYFGLNQAQTFRLALDAPLYAPFLAERLAALPPGTPAAVRALLASTLAWEAAARPDAAALERACDDLAGGLPGANLRRWARDRAWEAAPVAAGTLTGRSIEVSAPSAVAAAAEPPLTVAAPHPVDAPRPTPAAPAAAHPESGARPAARGAAWPIVLGVAALGLLVVGGGGALALGAWALTRGGADAAGAEVAAAEGLPGAEGLSAADEAALVGAVPPEAGGMDGAGDGAVGAGSPGASGRAGSGAAGASAGGAEGGGGAGPDAAPAVASDDAPSAAPAAAPTAEAAPAGGTPIALSSGLTVYAPAGWAGQAVDATRALMQGPDGNSLILASVVDTNGGDLRAELANPIDAGSGIVLSPSGTPRADGSGLTNDFSVSGTAIPARGVAYGRMLGDGRALVVLALGPSSSLDALRAAARPVYASARIGRSATASAGSGSWTAYLKGRALVRFYSGNGYSERHDLWLCSDGNFARRADGGGFDMGGTSGAFEGGVVGAWTASGSTSGVGTLTLVATDGSRSQYAVSMGSDGVYLDGVRWMRGDNERCN